MLLLFTALVDHSGALNPQRSAFELRVVNHPEGPSPNCGEPVSITIDCAYGSHVLATTTLDGCPDKICVADGTGSR